MEAEGEKVSSEAEISFYREMIRLMETETYLKNDAPTKWFNLVAEQLRSGFGQSEMSPVRYLFVYTHTK